MAVVRTVGDKKVVLNQEGFRSQVGELPWQMLPNENLPIPRIENPVCVRVPLVVTSGV